MPLDRPHLSFTHDGVIYVFTGHGTDACFRAAWAWIEAHETAGRLAKSEARRLIASVWIQCGLATTVERIAQEIEK